MRVSSTWYVIAVLVQHELSRARIASARYLSRLSLTYKTIDYLVSRGIGGMMRWWERQIGGPTRGRIIALLRRGVSTVDEIATALRVTDNAIRPHIQQLEHAGIVRATGTRANVGAGKPATTYEVAASAEPALSGAYAPVLGALLEALAERLPAEELDSLLR